MLSSGLQYETCFQSFVGTVNREIYFHDLCNCGLNCENKTREKNQPMVFIITVLSLGNPPIRRNYYRCEIMKLFFSRCDNFTAFKSTDPKDHTCKKSGMKVVLVKNRKNFFKHRNLLVQTTQ
jgi:hypothetical protein